MEGGLNVKYYLAGGQRIAMRTPNNNVSYLLSDHLGSTSLTVNSAGYVTSEMRYTPWGDTRFTSGNSPTNYRFTGQRQESGFGLYFYNARWYDSSLGRFAQADTVIPGGVQGLDRYAYGLNNPVRFIDPSGHTAYEGDGGTTPGEYCDLDCIRANRQDDTVRGITILIGSFHAANPEGSIPDDASVPFITNKSGAYAVGAAVSADLASDVMWAFFPPPSPTDNVFIYMTYYENSVDKRHYRKSHYGSWEAGSIFQRRTSFWSCLSDC